MSNISYIRKHESQTLLASARARAKAKQLKLELCINTKINIVTIKSILT